MPGILGYIGRFGESNSQPPLLERMAEALEPESRFSKELFQENGLGIGRVSLRITNPEKQPLWNEDGSLCLVMEGELFDYEAAKRDLTARGYQFQTESDGEFLLHLFAEYGEVALQKLNGVFAAAIWNDRERKLTLFNDRLGLQPLYYAQTKQGLLFASGMRSLLADKNLDKSIDEIAIAQFMTFDHLLSERTLLRNVYLMPQGSILTFQDGKYKVRRYWRLEHPQNYQFRSELEWMEMLIERLQQAVDRQAKDSVGTGLLLSGGIDSRAIFACLLNQKNSSPFDTFTFGIPGCDDAQSARELSTKSSVRNHFFELKPDWMLSKAIEAVRITDGMSNIVNLHAFASTEHQDEFAEIIYKGVMGGLMLGYGVLPPLWAVYSDGTRIQNHYQVHRDQGLISFDITDHNKLFTKSFQRQVGTAVIDSFRAGLDESGSSLLADQRIHFNCCQRGQRMQLNGVIAVRNRAVVRLPYVDNDFFDFAISLPPGWLYEKQLLRNAFIHAYPKLAQVPVSNTGLPMTSCFRDIQIRAGRWARWHLNAAGLPVEKVIHRPYKDYNSWFRTVLRSWVEDILLSRRALERGYFNPEYVQKVVNDHMSGANNAVRIGALISLELWHQQFIDQ